MHLPNSYHNTRFKTAKEINRYQSPIPYRQILLMMKKRLNCVLEFCSPLVVVYLVSCSVWYSISSCRTCVTELHISSNNNLLLDWLWYSKEKTTFRVCYNAEIFHNPQLHFLSLYISTLFFLFPEEGKEEEIQAVSWQAKVCWC